MIAAEYEVLQAEVLISDIRIISLLITSLSSVLLSPPQDQSQRTELGIIIGMSKFCIIRQFPALGISGAPYFNNTDIIRFLD